jgi:hypothetical protein
MSDGTLTWYGPNSPPLREKLAANTAACEEMVNRHLGEDVELARRLLDANYGLACHYMWFDRAPHIALPSKHITVSFAAFHKGLLMLSSCIDLTQRGFYGSARPLLRHTYEFLMIAKFCCVSPDNRVYDRWQKREVVYFTNAILKKISSPDMSPLADLWNELNELTHATRVSSQVDLHFPNIARDVQANLALIQVMADWLAHILTTHIITTSMRQVTRQYTSVPSALAAAWPGLKAELKASKGRHSLKSQRLIETFRKKWIVNS